MSLIRNGTGVARIKRNSGHEMMQILCEQNVDKFTYQIRNSFVIFFRKYVMCGYVQYKVEYTNFRYRCCSLGLENFIVFDVIKSETK